MEVCEFEGRIFGRVGRSLFLVEYTWDTCRPIEYVGWNGTKLQVVDKYREDLFDPYYGFGTAEMKARCQDIYLRTDYDSVQKYTIPEDFWRWCGTSGTWWRDRMVVLAPGADTSHASWRRYAVRPRTLKNRHKTNFKFTRKRIPTSK